MVIKAAERSSSPAPHDHSTTLCYAKYVIVLMNFRHVHRRQVERIVRRQPFGTENMLTVFGRSTRASRVTRNH